MRQVISMHSAPGRHWVGDGFPVRGLLSHREQGQRISPFVLLDYAGPAIFAPTDQRRGVGQHPHKGFETVTVVFEGEVEHRDSTGAGGVIGPGDVQWMTAGHGILHEEYHAPSYAKRGGPFEMVQLWVNLPAKDKSAPPGYQGIRSADIPVVALPNDAGRVRVIAGAFAGAKGPARTFTPIDFWDVRLVSGGTVQLDPPVGHTFSLVILSGEIVIDGRTTAGEAQTVLLSQDGGAVTVEAKSDTKLLVLSGEPIDEPVVAHGPFVMNTVEEIRRAMTDFQAGRFGGIAAPGA